MPTVIGRELEAFLGAVRLAAQIEREFSPAASEPEPVLRAEVARRRLALPAAGRDDLIAKLGYMLTAEAWGWKSWSYESDDPRTWPFTLSREDASGYRVNPILLMEAS